MKKCLLFFAFLCVNFTYGQIKETISDPNLNESPQWSGNLSAFRVNSSQQLQTAKSDSSKAVYLVTESKVATNSSWQFFVQLNFSPSASNYARVYLISDKKDLTDALHGYFLQIGENGSKDSYDLFKQDGEKEELLIDGKESRAAGSKVAVWIKVTRTADGHWTLYSRNEGESSYTSEGEVTDPQPFVNSTFFGLRCTYTKSRSDQFIFDDITVGPFTDDNPVPLPDTPGNTGITEIGPGDILISEILFNPRKDGADFLEIYNNTGHAIDVSALSLAIIKKDSLTSIKRVSKTAYGLAPHSYLVLTTNPDNVKLEYRTENPEAFLKMTSMPAFNDDAGTVVLLADSTRIDQLTYSAKMHFALIRNPEGVSLERVSFSRPTSDPGNFRSAAGTAGFATPGYQNSQLVTEGETTEEISLSSNTFSPDNDGFEDALMIHYHFAEGGKVANIWVFNDRGILVRYLCKNETLGQSGTITWDGLNDDNNRPPLGIYVVYIEIFDLAGHVKKYRKPCVLAAKL